jgi:hypothetical protein
MPGAALADHAQPVPGGAAPVPVPAVGPRSLITRPRADKLHAHGVGPCCVAAPVARVRRSVTDTEPADLAEVSPGQAIRAA